MKKVNHKPFKVWKIRYGVMSESRECEIEGYSLTHALKMHWSKNWNSFKVNDLNFDITFFHINKQKIKEIWCKLLTKDLKISERYIDRHRIIEVLEGEIPVDTPFIEELTLELEMERYKGPTS